MDALSYQNSYFWNSRLITDVLDSKTSQAPTDVVRYIRDLAVHNG